METQRYLAGPIIKDLCEKMVFLGGPRQVGKTTLARNLIGPGFRDSAYFNWDNRLHRTVIINLAFPGTSELIILDEIHKYSKWKNLIKGEYDVNRSLRKYLITGSARLNIYRKGGDSLQGRYHYYTLHPFSLAELLEYRFDSDVMGQLPIDSQDHSETLALLEKFGGFPEIFLKQNSRALRRWHLEHTERLFREDIRDLNAIRDLQSMQLLGDMLPSKVGSLLSVNSIREDLQVSHRSVCSWLNLFETFYYQFRVYPYCNQKVRSLKKGPKLYLIDWSEVPDCAARFENMIGSHLLKFVDYLREYYGYQAGLFYLRNIDQKEVDFLVTIKNIPWFCVEVKYQDQKISRNLYYYKDRLQIPYAFQVIHTSGIDRIEKSVRLISADRFLSALV